MPTGPILTLRGHTDEVWCVTFSLDGTRIVSGSLDKTLRVWDSLSGEAIGKPLRGHASGVSCVVRSPDGKRIVSGGEDGTLQIWDALTGKALGSPLRGHTSNIYCVAISPDGRRILSGSNDDTMRMWDSMSGEGIGPPLPGHTNGVNDAVWTPDGKRIVSSSGDRTIRIWDSVTRKQIGSPLLGHTKGITCIAVSADGKRIMSSSYDKTLRIWDADSGKALGSPLKGHTSVVRGAFSPDGTLIVSASDDKTIRVWDGMTGDPIGSPMQAHDSGISYATFSPDGNQIASCSDDKTIKIWDSTTIEALKLSQFTVKIGDDPSILTNVSHAVAQCQHGELDDAMRKFNLAIAISSSSPTSVASVCSVLVIQAIALFEAGRDETAIAQVDDLIRVGPRSVLHNAGFQMIKAYMLNQLAQKYFERDMYDHAVELLSDATSDDLLRTMDTYYKYRARIPVDQGLSIVTTLFGWEFEALRYTIHQNLCEALRRIGRSKDALDALENMGKRLKGDERKRYRKWAVDFKQESATEWSARGDQALENGHYDAAIEQYSGSITLDPSNYALYTNRSSAYASKQLWNEALDDAEQAIKLNPSLPIGYQLKHRALHGAERYDEAIVALGLFTGRSGTSFDDDIQTEIGVLASDVIKNMPTRLFDTTSGIMCNKGDILRKFKASDPYKKLVSSIITHDDLDLGDSVTNLVNSYFQFAMLSHRWEDGEILLQDIREGESVHDMKSNAAGLVKLQKLCIITLKLGILWAWSDTCCIDKKDAVELQRSIVSMYQWYSKSAVTIAYLSDVEESSSVDFTNSKWFTRGWTLQELLAPPVILFYKRDWSLFLDEQVGDEDGGHVNHKERDAILYMIEQVTEIDVATMRCFRPGMHDTRQKLRWASHRETTEVEDAAYSLFGMFDIQLPVIYGEKEKALGRLLQEIIGQGELAVLDWVGRRGNAHSCLPLDMSCFRSTQWIPPLLNEADIAAQILSLRDALLPQEITNLARVRQRLRRVPLPSFLHNRLSLACIVYPVNAVTQQPLSQRGRDRRIRQFIIKAKGLKGFDIQTTEMMHDSSEARPSEQKYFVAHLIRNDLLKLLMGDPEDEATGVFEMIVALSRPFLPFLLLQRGQAYQRIAVLEDVSTEVEDMTAVRAEGLDVTTLDIL